MRDAGSPATLRRGRTAPRRALRLALAGLVVAGVAVAGAPAAAEVLLLAVHLNGLAVGSTAVLERDASGCLRVDAVQLAAWRLVPPAAGGDSEPSAERSWCLAELPGVSYRIDERAQALWIEADPAAFEASELSAARRPPPDPARSSVGAFVNYDLLVERLTGELSAGGFLEGVAFTPGGVLTSGFVVTDSGRRWRRLDSTWTLDLPRRTATLRLGDGWTAGGALGRRARFGGIQWATNFATRPDLDPRPLPSIAAEAILPSSVDLLVDGVLRLHRDVEPGPFEIRDVPVVDGDGRITLRVRDLLGRETVVVEPYATHGDLLRRGLSESSFEAGLLREPSPGGEDRYRRWMVAGTHRRGVTDRFSVGGHGEVAEGWCTGVVEGRFLVPALGLAGVSGGLSREREGDGYQLGASLERRSGRVTFAAGGTWFSPRFRQLGLRADEAPPVREVSARVGLSSHRYGGLSVALVERVRRDAEPVELVTLSYSLHLGERLGLVASAVVSLAGGGDDAVTLTARRRLGGRRLASVGGTLDAGGGGARLRLARPSTLGPGTSYRLEAEAGGGRPGRARAEWAAEGRLGRVTLAADARSGGGGADLGLRLGLAGGVGLVGGHGFLAPRLDDSFALVRVPDSPGVRLYLDHRLAARTDRRGWALIPRLRPYEVNALAMEVDDLPLEAHFGDAEVVAVPRFRSGLRVDFPVRVSPSALVEVVLEDGSWLPVGAEVTFEDGAGAAPAGYRGEVFVTDLVGRRRARARWSGGSCEFAVEPPPAGEPGARLAPVVCRTSEGGR